MYKHRANKKLLVTKLAKNRLQGGNAVGSQAATHCR
jgi:hypothetical protein